MLLGRYLQLFLLVGSPAPLHGFKAKYKLKSSFEGVPQVSIGKSQNTDHVVPANGVGGVVTIVYNLWPLLIVSIPYIIADFNIYQVGKSFHFLPGMETEPREPFQI